MLSYLSDRSDLPADLLEVGMRIPEVVERFRQNPFLDYPTWSKLLQVHNGSNRVIYLIRNLTTRKANAILKQLPLLGIEDSRALADIDFALAEWFNAHPMSLRTAHKVAKSKLVHVSHIALRSTLPIELKVEIAKNAYVGNRLLWLQNPEADSLSDDEVWNVASLPERLEDCHTGTMLDSRCCEARVKQGASLLYLRPELKDKAIASQDPNWIYSASMVPLTSEQQAALVKAAETYWEGDEAKKILKDFAPSYYSSVALDPIGNVGLAPWCTEDTWQYLQNREGSLTHVKDDVLYRSKVNSWDRDAPLRNRLYRPNVDLRTVEDQRVAEKWAEDACWGDQAINPYVLLELLANRKTGKKARELRRDGLLRYSETIREILLRSGNFSESKMRKVNIWHCSEPSVTKEELTRVAGGDWRMWDSFWGGDGGLAVLSAAGFTPMQWHIALTLQDDFGEITLNEFVEMVKTM